MFRKNEDAESYVKGGKNGGKKYKSHVMLGVLGVLGIFVLLLNTSPALADSNGILRIESDPVGADVYILLGPNAGEYVGTTPFSISLSDAPLSTYLKIVKPGYYQGIFALNSYMFKQPYVKAYMVPK